jgi:hypothetical protein
VYEEIKIWVDAGNPAEGKQEGPFLDENWEGMWRQNV